MCIHVHAKWHPQCCDAQFACSELWRLCCGVTLITLIYDLVIPSECGGNQISVVIDTASEVMPLLLRLYKGQEGDCHSGIALGVVRKLLPGNLMHLKPSYTNSIYPQHDLGTLGIKMKRRGSAAVWGSHSYLRWHSICTWLTSYTFINASPESLNALPEPQSGSFSIASLNASNTHLCSYSNCTLSGLLIAHCWAWSTPCLK